MGEPEVQVMINTIFNTIIEMYHKHTTIDKLPNIVYEIVDNKVIYGNNGMLDASSVDMTGTFIIKIDGELIKDIINQFITGESNTNQLLIRTLSHELTHAIDFNNYLKHGFNLKPSDKTTLGFHMWTEYNATKIAYMIYIKEIFLDKFLSTEHINQLRTYQVPTVNNEFENSYINSLLNNKSYEMMHSTAHYFGRYSVWEDIDKEYFLNNELISDILKEHRMLKMYKLLKEMNTFDTAKESFEILGDYVYDIWKINMK